MADKKQTPQERYEKKNGITVKSFKVKKLLAEQFAETCEHAGVSQSAAITKLMEQFISEHKEQ